MAVFIITLNLTLITYRHAHGPVSALGYIERGMAAHFLPLCLLRPILLILAIVTCRILTYVYERKLFNKNNELLVANFKI